MRNTIIQGLSVLFLILAIVWFILEPGFEPVLTAVAGLVGLFSAEFLKGGETGTGSPSGPSDARIPELHIQDLERESILVLPFDNISPDPEDAYFSDGLTDEVITTLSRLKSLRVISRNSAMAVKGSGKDTRSMAAELRVQYVLHGSVRKSGDDLRISAQLVRAASDENLWAESYQGVMEDVFGIQEDVSRAIVDALTLTLSPEEEEQLTARPFQDPTAYDCYLRARQEFWKVTPESLDAAFQHVQNGLKIVGENELLLATQGYVTMQRITFGIAAAPEHLPKAEDLARDVFRINPHSAHGHTLLGWIRFRQGRPDDAAHHLKEALRRDPGIVEAVFWLAITYLSAGKEAKAAPWVRELLRIDPLTAAHHSILAYWHVLRRETPEALAAYQRMFEMDPGNPFTGVLWGRMLVFLGEKERGQEVLEQIVDPTSQNPMLGHANVLLHLVKGQEEEAAAAITPTLEEASRYDEHLSWWMADWFGALGREEEAVRWLRHAADLGFFSWPVLREIDPFLDPIREGPAFREFMTELEAKWKAFDG